MWACLYVYLNRNRYAYIRELWQRDSFSCVKFHFIHQTFLKPHLHPVPLISILKAQCAHCKLLTLPNCCCHRGWTSEALPLPWALSKLSFSKDRFFTDSISTILFCRSPHPSPSLPVSQAARQPWNQNMQQSQDWRFVQMEMEIPTFIADLLTDGTAPHTKVLLLMEKQL